MAPNAYQNQSAERNSACIWMQAGVVRKKYCRLAYECTICRYDQALQRTARKNRQLRRRGERLSGKRAGIVFWRRWATASATKISMRSSWR